MDLSRESVDFYSSPYTPGSNYQNSTITTAEALTNGWNHHSHQLADSKFQPAQRFNSKRVTGRGLTMHSPTGIFSQPVKTQHTQRFTSVPPRVHRWLSNPEENLVARREVLDNTAMSSSWDDQQLSTYFNQKAEISETGDSSDEESSPSHPNKFPVAIEEHKRKECSYKRHQGRSGHYIKIIRSSGEVFNMKQTSSEMPTLDEDDPPQILRYYRKDLVRMCRCGLYVSQEHMLNNSGRSNDSDGYEVHYSQKCKWKFYEDFKTKKRVLIRLCKCYKPAL